MKETASILIVLTDHNRRVRFRRMVEENFGITVFSAANPIDGLSILETISPPDFIILSSQGLPLMSYEEFLNQIERESHYACIPIVLLSTTPIRPLPKGVQEEVTAPISEETLSCLIKKYC